MEYGKIKYVDKPVSRIVFGCAIPSMIEGKNVDDYLEEIYRLGINTFDTAENYLQSEASLGHWLKTKKHRDDVVIISKGCHPYDGVDRVNPEELKRDIEHSFYQLHTDYIDVYMLHRDDLKIEPDAVVEVLNEYHKAGKIGAFGASNWSHERIAQANRYAQKKGLVPFSVSSPNYSLCSQVGDPWGGGAGCVTISGEKNRDARQWYVENDMPVIAYSSLGRGMFSGKFKSSDREKAKKLLDEGAVKGYYYPENFERLARTEKMAGEKGCTVPQLALAWLLRQELNVFPVISTGKIDSLASNIKALDIKLSEEESCFLNLEEKNSEK